MIVKVYNENKYMVIKSCNETAYYREIMRLKLNMVNKVDDAKTKIQKKINFFSS